MDFLICIKCPYPSNGDGKKAIRLRFFSWCNLKLSWFLDYGAWGSKFPEGGEEGGEIPSKSAPLGTKSLVNLARGNLFLGEWAEIHGTLAKFHRNI